MTEPQTKLAPIQRQRTSRRADDHSTEESGEVNKEASWGKQPQKLREKRSNGERSTAPKKRWQARQDTTIFGENKLENGRAEGRG